MQLNLCTEREWADCYGDIDFCLGFLVGGVFSAGNCLPVLNNTHHSRSDLEQCQQGWKCENVAQKHYNHKCTQYEHMWGWDKL